MVLKIFPSFLMVNVETSTNHYVLENCNTLLCHKYSNVKVPFVVSANCKEDGSCKASQDQRDSGDIEVFQYSLFGAKSSLARCAL